MPRFISSSLVLHICSICCNLVCRLTTVAGHFHCSCFFTFLFVYAVMKCLLEAHDSNPARFDRECMIHLSSRLSMWELAAKVGTEQSSCFHFNQFRPPCPIFSLPIAFPRRLDESFIVLKCVKGLLLGS